MEEEVVQVCYFLSAFDVLWVPQLFVLVQLDLWRLVYVVHAFSRVELLPAQICQLHFLGRRHGVLCFRFVHLGVLARWT